jgi:CheY-like chemotaxis protein
VDGQPAKLLTYEAILGGLGVRCVRALSGKEALEHLLVQDFAVLILDVHMPEMDGFELAALVREHPCFERVPIIFATGAHITELDQLRGYEAGALDYVSVPAVPEILRSKVAMLVELYLKRQELQRLNRELKEARSRSELDHARALTDKDAYLSAVLSHPDPFFIVVRAVRDPHGHIRDWSYVNVNDAALPMFGMGRHELIGKSMREVLPDRSEQGGQRCVSAHCRVTSPSAMRLRGRHETCSSPCTPLAPTQWLHRALMSPSVTARSKHFEETSDAAEHCCRMRPLQSATSHSTADSSMRTGVCQLLGYSAEELRHMRWQDITHPDDLEMDNSLVQRAFNSELRHYTLEKRRST